nr:hypothetical protein [Tanacetum cinerariifolium]
MELLLAKERILKLIQAWDEKQIESWSFPVLLPQLLNDSQTIDEMLKQREKAANMAVQKEREEQAEYLENSSNAIAPVLLTEKPEYSLSMGYEHLSTTPEMESDEVIKSSAKKLVPIPSEYEVTFDDENECDVPVCEDSSTFDVLEDHYEILSDFNNNDISSDDDAFEDIKYVEASPLDSELVSLEEEHDVYQEESLTWKIFFKSKTLFFSSSSFPIFENSVSSLSYSDNSLHEFYIFSDHTIDIFDNSLPEHDSFCFKMELDQGRLTSVVMKDISDNSLPEHDSFCFKMELDQGRLTSVVMKDISDNSTNDTLLEEVDLFLALDNSIPLGIENFDYESEGDIHFLEELLVDDSIPLPKNESSNFDHHNDPSFSRPSPEPPDVEFCFDFEPNSEKVISDIDELNEDECFDLGGEIDVFSNIKDDDYFPFIFAIRIFLPYLIYPEVSSLLLSAGNEDTIFDPGIST